MVQPKPQRPSDFGRVDSGADHDFRSEISEIVSFFKTLVIFLAIAILLRASVVEAFRIPSGSMKPTLQIGDHILVSKLSYGLRIPFKSEMIWRYSEPRRGDVVVFTKPDDPTTLEDESKINIIKRVIGLPGDVIEIHKTTVLINGKAYHELDYEVRWEEGGLVAGNFGPARVPAGTVFLLGDNRDHSRDSRFWDDSPFLEIDRIKGKAFIIYWSWDSPRRIATIIN